MIRNWGLAILITAAGACSAHRPPEIWLPSSPLPVAAVATVQEVDWQDGLAFQEALNLALKQNADLQTARTERDRANAEKVLAEQWPYNPELSTEFSRTIPFNKQEDQRFKVGLGQTFEIAGQRGIRIRIAEEAARRAEAVIVDMERRVRVEVTLAYFQTVAADGRLAIARQNLSLAEKLLNAAEARFQARQVPEIEVNLVKVQYQRTLADQFMRENQSRNAKAELSRLIGEPGRTGYALSDDLRAEPLQEVDRDKARGLALEKRADLAVLRSEEQIALLRVDLESRLVWPDPTVELFYENEKAFFDSPTGGIKDNDNIFGAGVSVPLPIFNRRRGEIMVAEAERRRIEASILSLTHKIISQVNIAVNDLELARKVLDTYEKELNRLSRKNVEDFEKAYRAGEVGTLEVLRAQEDANRVAEGYLESLLNYRNALASFRAVVSADISDLKK